MKYIVKYRFGDFFPEETSRKITVDIDDDDIEECALDVARMTKDKLRERYPDKNINILCVDKAEGNMTSIDYVKFSSGENIYRYYNLRSSGSG